jgi:hypothetical protein
MLTMTSQRHREGNRINANAARPSSAAKPQACMWTGGLGSMVFLLLLSSPLSACDVPLCRYALEHWRPDFYEVTVFHDGPLSRQERALVDSLESGQDQANYILTVVDRKKQPGPQGDQRFTPPPSAKFPCLIVNFPAAAQIDTKVWVGPHELSAVESLTTSPIRRTLTRKIIGGETAVFLLVEGGRKDQDDAAVRLLRDELRRLPEQLKRMGYPQLPEGQPAGEGPLQRAAFSLIRIARNDPSEQMLLQMLLHGTEDPVNQPEPMVFPVFGRGRVLPPLVGAEITRDNIQGIGTFLIGPCSCEVKRQNPGIDLLMAVDWDEELSRRKHLPSPLASVELATLTGAATSPAELEDVPGGRNEHKGHPRSPSRLMLLTAVTLSALATIVTGILAFWPRRRKKDRPK